MPGRVRPRAAAMRWSAVAALVAARVAATSLGPATRRRAAPAPSAAAARSASARERSDARIATERAAVMPVCRAGARMPRRASSSPPASTPPSASVARSSTACVRARSRSTRRGGASGPRRAAPSSPPRRPRTPSATPSERRMPRRRRPRAPRHRAAALVPMGRARAPASAAPGPAATAASVRCPSRAPAEELGLGGIRRSRPASGRARRRATGPAFEEQAAPGRGAPRGSGDAGDSPDVEQEPGRAAAGAERGARRAKPLAAQASGSTRTSASDRLSPDPRARWRALPTSISVASRGGRAWTIAPSSRGVK